MKESIKRFRREKRMTQKQLADKLGVSLSAVGMWELGLRNPPAKKLPALAAALGCSIDELFGAPEAAEAEERAAQSAGESAT